MKACEQRILIFLVAGVLLLVPVVSGIETIPVCTAPDAQVYPAIDGTHVVWADNRTGDWDIHMYDLESGADTRITTDPAEQSYAAISGDRIVYENITSAGNADIYLYDLGTGVENVVCATYNNQWDPAIDGDHVVWQDRRYPNGDIILHNISTGTETRLTADTKVQKLPEVSGDHVVWQDNSNGYGDIYLYDISTGAKTQITTNPNEQSYPAISGNRIVYENRSAGNYDIYLYDLGSGSESVICADPAFQWAPAIDGDRVVWQDNRTGDWEIYLYDIGTGVETRITTDPADQVEPAISGNHVVWQDYRNGNADVFRADLNEPPAANFTWTPAVPVAGEPVNFTDTSTSGPITWEWAFGDGTTSIERNPIHTFAAPGNYTVRLTAYYPGSEIGRDAVRTVRVSAQSVGGSTGYLLVSTAPAGARVFLRDIGGGLSLAGNTSAGPLNVTVYLTGTPVAAIVANLSGYADAVYNVTQYPSAGQTVPVNLTLAPAVLPVPPSTLLPTDTSGDGTYDDVNGNGRKDFNDVVLYFPQMTWIAANEPVSAFDYNANGRIDFADVVWLFSHL